MTETAPGSGVYMNRTGDLVTTAGSAVVTSASSNFTAMGLAPGGRFAIATGPDAGLYTIASVDSATRVTLTQALTASRTGIAFSAQPLMTASVSGAPGDGVLQAVHGDTLTVSYLDCNDGDADAANDVKTDTAAFNAPPLLINRVLFAPAGSPSCQTELVELINASSAAIVATGYRIEDEDAQLSYTIPDFDGSPLTLQPGERLILSIGGSFWDFYEAGTYYLFLADASYPSNLLGGPGDADPADQVQLFDPLGRVVDYVGWSATVDNSIDFYGDDSASVLAAIWQDDAFRDVSSITAGQVLRRSSDGFDTNRASDWTFAGDDTCQVILDIYALTRATILGVEIDPAGLVEFATATQKGTVGFDLYETDRVKGGRLSKLNAERVAAPIHDSLAPIVYRAETAPITLPWVVIEEIDESGRRQAMGPFPVGEPRAAAALRRVQSRLDAAGAAPRGVAMRAVPGSAWRRTARESARRRSRTGPPPVVPGAPRDGVKLRVNGGGVAEVRLADLAPWGLDARLARKGGLRLWNQGREVEYRELPGGDPRIAFRTEPLATDMAEANVYVLTWGRPAAPMAVALTRSGPALPAGYTRVERSAIYLPHAPREADPWLWDLLFTGGGAWPYEWWDPTAGSFDLPSLALGASGSVPVRLHLVGGTRHRHEVRAWINDIFVGVVAFDGTRPGLLEGSVDASALAPAGNRLVLEYSADTVDAWDWGLAYVDALDLGMPVSSSSVPVAVEEVGVYEPALPPLGRVGYLIVTHGDF
ncbi:MAG TPA: lamin tail domain-containing protein, partial [Pseudonocardia sp.]|nr:lamin tail domain-containing protein [Pseudonocardia sp.]